jgi:hypothetical protein
MLLLTQIHITLIFLSYALNFAHDLIPHDHLHEPGAICVNQNHNIDETDHHCHFHFGLFDHEHISQTHNTQFRALSNVNIINEYTFDINLPIVYKNFEIDYKIKFLSYLALIYALSDSDRILNISDRAPPIA